MNVIQTSSLAFLLISAPFFCASAQDAKNITGGLAAEKRACMLWCPSGCGISFNDANDTCSCSCKTIKIDDNFLSNGSATLRYLRSEEKIKVGILSDGRTITYMKGAYPLKRSERKLPFFGAESPGVDAAGERPDITADREARSESYDRGYRDGREAGYREGHDSANAEHAVMDIIHTTSEMMGR